MSTDVNPTGTASLPGRTYWKTVLAAGGSTAVPRWTLHPAPGVAEYEAPIPDEDVATLRRVLAVPLRTVLLAAHASVLAALSGEREVVAGYVAGAGSPAAAVPADDGARLVARAGARDAPGRVGAAAARRLPGGRPAA